MGLCLGARRSSEVLRDHVFDFQPPKVELAATRIREVLRAEPELWKVPVVHSGDLTGSMCAVGTTSNAKVGSQGHHGSHDVKGLCSPSHPLQKHGT